MASGWFLLAVFGLCWTSPYFAQLASPVTDPRYNSTLQAVIDILWESLKTEIQYDKNALIFSIPFARDVVLMDRISNEETKNEVRKSLQLYERFGRDLETVDEDVTVKSLREMRFRTIFYAPMPFASLTLATWNITTVEGMHRGFQWITNVNFTISETSSMQIRAMRGYATYDYTEFVYPRLNGCTGRVVRLRYKLDFNLTFVIPSDKKMCSSSEDLWKNVQHVNLNGLNYERRTMFLSLPLFQVYANIDLKMRLKGTAFARAFDQESSGLYNALAFQAAEVIFNPEIFNKNFPIPSFGEDQFRAERPFFFALFHSTSQAPIFASLISNPRCLSDCKK